MTQHKTNANLRLLESSPTVLRRVVQPAFLADRAIVEAIFSKCSAFQLEAARSFELSSNSSTSASKEVDAGPTRHTDTPSSALEPKISQSIVLPSLAHALQTAKRSRAGRDTAFDFDEVLAEPVGYELFCRFLHLVGSASQIETIEAITNWFTLIDGFQATSTGASALCADEDTQRSSGTSDRSGEELRKQDIPTHIFTNCEASPKLRQQLKFNLAAHAIISRLEEAHAHGAVDVISCPPRAVQSNSSVCRESQSSPHFCPCGAGKLITGSSVHPLLLRTATLYELDATLAHLDPLELSETFGESATDKDQPIEPSQQWKALVPEDSTGWPVSAVQCLFCGRDAHRATDVVLSFGTWSTAQSTPIESQTASHHQRAQLMHKATSDTESLGSGHWGKPGSHVSMDTPVPTGSASTTPSKSPRPHLPHGATGPQPTGGTIASLDLTASPPPRVQLPLATRSQASTPAIDGMLPGQTSPEYANYLITEGEIPDGLIAGDSRHDSRATVLRSQVSGQYGGVGRARKSRGRATSQEEQLYPTHARRSGSATSEVGRPTRGSLESIPDLHSDDEGDMGLTGVGTTVCFNAERSRAPGSAKCTDAARRSADVSAQPKSARWYEGVHSRWQTSFAHQSATPGPEAVSSIQTSESAGRSAHELLTASWSTVDPSVAKQVIVEATERLRQIGLNAGTSDTVYRQSFQRPGAVIGEWLKHTRTRQGLPFPCPSSLAAGQVPSSIQSAMDDSTRTGIRRSLVAEARLHLNERMALLLDCALKTGSDGIERKHKSLAATLEQIGMACVESLRSRWWPLFVRSAYFAAYIRLRLASRRHVTVTDFEYDRRLGRGGFGSVFACVKRDTGVTYAIKRMNKARMVKIQADDLCLAERRVLGMLDSPFIVPMYYAFQTPQHIFLVMKCMAGGDLGHRLNLQKRFSIEQTRFYAAQLVLALEHIHEKGIIYRDLKPENVLLDERGNVRLTDMGLATVGPAAIGRCGTRGYWAPEMLVRSSSGERIPYTKLVDWWSFGCLLYEMVYGKSPFRTNAAKNFVPGDQQESMDAATLRMTVTFNRRYFTVPCAEFINHLLQRNIQDRLGYHGVDEIKNHPFFEGIDWGMLRRGALPPPPLTPHPPLPDESRIMKSGDSAWDIKEQRSRIQFPGWQHVNCIDGQVDACEFLRIVNKRFTVGTKSQAQKSFAILRGESHDTTVNTAPAIVVRQRSNTEPVVSLRAQTTRDSKAGGVRKSVDNHIKAGDDRVGGSTAATTPSSFPRIGGQKTLKQGRTAAEPHGVPTKQSDETCCCFPIALPRLNHRSRDVHAVPQTGLPKGQAFGNA